MAPSLPPPLDLRATVVRVGQPRTYLRDLYAFLIETRWRHLIALCFAAYGLANAVFASLYLESGDCIAGARSGSFFDAFFFSVQTLATIGYGAMSPAGVCGHVIVGFESIIGLLSFALITGIVFAKFARPHAGVQFSRRAVVTNRNGVPHLMFRVANARGSDIVQASIHVSVLLDEVTQEGSSMRRFYDLALERSATPVLIMSWLVMHRIDEKSPIYGMGPEDFARCHASITTSLTGMDGTFMQTVYTYHQYQPQDVAWNRDYVDVIRRLPDGRFELDLTKFDELKG